MKGQVDISVEDTWGAETDYTWHDLREEHWVIKYKLFCFPIISICCEAMNDWDMIQAGWAPKNPLKTLWDCDKEMQVSDYLHFNHKKQRGATLKQKGHAIF